MRWVDLDFGYSTVYPILLGQMGIWQNHLGNWARCNLKMTLDFQEESPLQERDAVRRVRLQHGVRVRAAAAQEGAPRHSLRLCLRCVRHGLH